MSSNVIPTIQQQTKERKLAAILVFSLLILLNIIQYNWDLLVDSKYSIKSAANLRSTRMAKNEEFPRCADRVWTQSSRKREVNMTFVNKHKFTPCHFTPIEEGGPTPVVFVVNGRSGSDATWATLSTLAGGKSPIGEHTGENKVMAMDFLGRMTEEEGAWWVTEHLCQFAHRHCDKPLVGFKWKPFVDSWELPAAQGMLKKIAKFNQPKIKVIFMTRNPLDVLISKRKHKTSGHTIQAHCTPDDEDCIKNHAKTGTHLLLPTDTLMEELSEAYAAFEVFESTLQDMGISFVKTTYEDLYGRDDAEEWMRLFKFLGRGPTENLTMKNVTGSFSMVSTSAKNHNESLANYDEVFNLLVNTTYEGLLH